MNATTRTLAEYRQTNLYDRYDQIHRESTRSDESAVERPGQRSIPLWRGRR